MALPFRWDRVKELAYPEGLGLVGVAVGHLMARSIDMSLGYTKAFRRVSDWMHLAALGGGAYAYGKGMNPGVTRGVVLGDAMLLVTSFGDLLYERTAGPKIREIAASRGVAIETTAGILAGKAGNPWPDRAKLPPGTGEVVPVYSPEQKPIRMTK